ncbi:MAG: hypothetical protein N2Z21_07605 [Candidatus Sumerlaeaceae bacterium]|nr:hypothetical protein [Candidatus Sumerlaeaceae bacterium]
MLMQGYRRTFLEKLWRISRWRWLGCYLVVLGSFAAFNYAQFTYRREIPRIPYLTGFDDLAYFAYARSLFFDNDINFCNDYQHLVMLFQDYLAGPPIAQWLRENPARPPNIYPIGTGLAALPFLLAFHVLAKMLVFGGIIPVAPSPFSSWYVLAYLFGNLCWGVLGLWLTSQMLQRVFSSPVAHIATYSCLFAGPALFYFVYQPGMSHLTGLACVAFAVWSIFQWDSEATPLRRRVYAILAGIAIGLTLLVRPANLPLVFLFLTPMSRYESIPLHQRLTELLLSCASAVLSFLPQLFAWRYLYGSFFPNPYGYGATFFAPHFWQVLFGRRHGLFFWHPWLLLALVGLIGMARSHPRRYLPALAVILGMAWIYGNWEVYWLGAAFGMRGYVEFIPLFAFGAAWLIRWIRQLTRSQVVPLGIIAMFTILNFHLMICFRGAVVTVDGPLFWHQTLRGGHAYWEQLAREWRILSTWQWGAMPGERAFPWEDIK